ncbi:MAG: NADH-quinone oxidoreductase subunit N [Planctomycetes bacterium]|nr:NADH-quinone oxidoreductase subunit N [Planctomycetota bacterium]MCC6405799.1 NADH-quinone oxidoreductase subunit N [Planctomycetota bacterium]
MTPNDLALVGPILLPALAALLVILVDLLPGSQRSGGSFLLAVLGAAVSLGYTIHALMHDREGLAFFGTMKIDRMALLITLFVHASALMSLLLSKVYLDRRSDVEQPEYHAFVLTSAAGMAMLAGANDLVNVFLGIELLSIPLYLLVAMRKHQSRSVEAGFKYLLLGAFASAFMLFGAALLYGSSGSTMLTAIPTGIARIGNDTPLAAFGASMLLVGLLFKVAAVPFHMWTPDVYEGAPTPVTAFMATATKAATFAVLLRLAPTLGTALGEEQAANLLGGLAVLTMFVGNLGALQQLNLKRLLAYSSISHAGYLLVGLAALVRAHGSSVEAEAASSIVYYLGAYTAMSLGAFAVAVLIDGGKDREAISDLAGLGKRNPLLAAAMTVFALALAGVPPTAGFFAKYYVFLSAVDAGLIAVAVLGVLASVIGLYYYLRILLTMYVDEPKPGHEATVSRDAMVAAVSLTAVAFVLLLGIVPKGFVEAMALAH